MAVHRTEIVQMNRGGIDPVRGRDKIEVSVVSLGAFEGSVRDAVVALKYGHDRGAARFLGQKLASLLPPGVDIVSWIPTAPSRVRRRGFDQSELIARHVARIAGVRCRSLLRRVDETRQTGSDRAARLSGPRLIAHRRCRDRRVVLVDDVVTTGATARAASAAVFAAGAAHVTCLCASSVGPR